MKIEYKFVTGENVSIEVYGEFEEIMLELDKNFKNNDRKETRRHENLDLLDKDERTADITTDVFEDVLKNLDKNKLYDAIAKLKPQEQELIHNLYLCQKPISQIELARIKNVSIGSIKMQLQRIKNKLKKLKKLGIKTLHGGSWTSDMVKKILLNEKYTGNALLQKKFISDHLTKTLKKNTGELPMYYAEGTHKPIIEKVVFEKVCENMERNRQKVKSSKESNIVYPFTSKIKCLNCGKNYKRKKYRGIAHWNCTTYLEEGKDQCFSKRIPEQILMSKACEVLGINNFDENLFSKNIKQILVPENGLLTFVFYDGNEVTLKWENKSRSESWSEDKRQMAREKALERTEINACGKIRNSNTCN